MLAVEVFEIIGNHGKTVAAIKVIGIDYGKGFLYHILAHEHGVVGSPRFYTAFGNGKTLGKVIEFLEDQLHGNDMGIFFENLFPEIFLEQVAYDKNDFSKSPSNGIVNGIIHDGFSIRTETVELFEASITATHSGGQDKKCRFHIGIFYSVGFAINKGR